MFQRRKSGIGLNPEESSVSKPNEVSLWSSIVIVISRFQNRYLKAKRTRAPAYSRALRRIKAGFFKGEFPKGGDSREAQVRFLEYQEGTQ